MRHNKVLTCYEMWWLCISIARTDLFKVFNVHYQVMKPQELAELFAASLIFYDSRLEVKVRREAAEEIWSCILMNEDVKRCENKFLL